MNQSKYPLPLLLIVGLLACFSWVSAAQAERDDVARIIVSGEGVSTLEPDMAVLSLTVTREAKTARQALDANSAAMAEVLKAMKREGIADIDLQTSNFGIQPNYFYPPQKPTGEREPPRIVGYIVRNSLSVRVRELNKLGAILDKSVTLGVNEGGNITFSNDDPAAAISDARVKAVQQAVAKANTLAGAAGVAVGDILEISEQSYAPRPVSIARAEMAMSMRGGRDSVPVAAGENAYKITVSMQFAIEQ